MRKIIDNFINFILVLLSIVIIAVTVYFCLDVFGVIDVPDNLSIANLFYSKIEYLAVVGSSTIENTIDNSSVSKPVRNIIRDDENNNTEVVEGETENNSNKGDILKRLQELEEKEKSNQKKETVDVNDSRKLYYSQLDIYGKTIYDELYRNKDKLKTGTYTAEFNTQFNDLLHEETGMDTLNDSFQLAINALTFDNPDLFYIDVTKIYLLTEITTRAFSKTYKVSIGGNGGNYLFNDFVNDGEVERAISDVEKVRKTLISECSGKNDVEKLRIVHDYIVDNTEYDLNAGNNIYNVYGSLINGRCVCEGYARAYKYILDELNIPCVIACGIGRNSVGTTESHAWNYVLLEGKWYAVDTTWDDPVITNGSGERVTGQRRDTYFLKGSNTISSDHFEDGNIVGSFNFKYPKLSETDY